MYRHIIITLATIALLLLLTAPVIAAPSSSPGNLNPIPNPQNLTGLWCLYFGGLPQGGGSVSLDPAGHGSAYAAHVTLAGGKGVTSDGGGISDEFALLPGQYSLSAWYQGSLSTTAVLRPGIDLFDAGGVRIARIDDAINQPVKNWQQWTLTFTAPEDTAQAQVIWSLWEDGSTTGDMLISDWNLQPASPMSNR